MGSYYIAFYKGRKSDNPDTSFFDRLVCLVTLHPYSHVELVYLFSETSKIGGVWSSSPRDGGVRTTNIQFSPKHWDLYLYEGELPLGAEEDTVAYAHSWFRPKDNMRYDWVGAVASVVRFLKQVETKYFCSEIVAEFFGYKRPSTYTPRKLFKRMKNKLKKVEL